ncbi:UNVERIFIED_CONTAM: hypothetical protein HDU68_006515 [Siphonaria sp. JEL0065]|nr:hypothetical protein HDU68_006515 [Siphonaria sp. JEL0065]
MTASSPRLALSQSYGPADRTESIAVLNRLVERNATFIDTADIYGQNGHNESLIGDWLKESGLRNKVFLCTKFGFKSLDPIVVCGSKEYVKEACDASLKRLQVDSIDLYYQHRADPNTPIEETVSAMAELFKEGKAHKTHPIAAVQVEYSPWTTDIEHNGVLATCNELGITIVAFSPLGRGFLTGQYKSVEDFDPTDSRRFMPRFQGEAFAQNLKLVDSLQEISTKKGITLTQLTLAWVAQQGPNVIPIPGTKKVSRLDENLGAIGVVLTEEENASVRAVIDSIPAIGERYAPKFLALSNI